MPRDIVPAGVDRRLEKRSPFLGSVKDCVAELFGENGGHKCAIDRFGMSLARAYTFTSHHHDDQLSFARVAALSSAKATAAARWLATLCGGVFVPLSTLRQGGDALKLAGESARANGQAVAEAVAALADGKVSAREASAVVKTVDAAIADMASLRGSLVAMAGGEVAAR